MKLSRHRAVKSLDLDATVAASELDVTAPVRR